jgi:hypothetical protein
VKAINVGKKEPAVATGRDWADDRIKYSNMIILFLLLSSQN